MTMTYNTLVKQVQDEVDDQRGHESVNGNLGFAHAGQAAVKNPEPDENQYPGQYDLDHRHALYKGLSKDEGHQEWGNEKNDESAEQPHQQRNPEDGGNCAVYRLVIAGIGASAQHNGFNCVGDVP